MGLTAEQIQSLKDYFQNPSQGGVPSPVPPEEPVEEEKPSRFQAVIGAVAEPVFKIPGVKKAVDVISAPAEWTVGTASSTIETVLDDWEKKSSVGTALKTIGVGLTGGALSPFESEARERIRETVGIEDDDTEKSVRELLKATRTYQRERDSLFKGEKFFSELILDPINLLAPLKAFKVAGAAGGVAVRTPKAIKSKGLIGAVPEAFNMRRAEKLQAIEDAKIRKSAFEERRAAQKEFGNWLDMDTIAKQGFTPNAARRLSLRATRTKWGKIPVVHNVIKMFGGSSATIDAAATGDRLAVRELAYKRFLEQANAGITADVAGLRALELDGALRMTTVDGNLHVIAKTKQGVDSKPIPLGDFMERGAGERKLLDEIYGELDLTTKELGMIEGAAKRIEAYRANIPEGKIDDVVGFAEGESYFPRIMAAVQDVSVSMSTKGGGLGSRQVIQKSRFNEFAAETINNGNKIWGEGARTPVSDIVEIYGKASARVKADDELAKYMVEQVGTDISSLVNSNAIGDYAGALKRHRRWKSLADTFAERIKLGHLKPATLLSLKRVDRDLWARVEAAQNLPLLAQRQAAFKELQPKFVAARDDAKVLLDEKRIIKDQAKEGALGRSGLEPIREHPALAGYAFTPEDVDAFLKIMERPPTTGVLPTLATISQYPRALMLGIDFGFHLVQGAMVLTNAPRIFGKALGHSMRAMFDPKHRNAWLARPENQDVLFKLGNKIQLSSEMGEAAGVVKSHLRKFERATPVAGRIPGSLARGFQAFQDSFELAFDVARIEMARSFMHLVDEGAITIDDLADYVNKSTGVTSSRALGVGATQAQIESTAIFLAPRYTRAITGLMMDAAQGGFRGDRARKAMIRFFGVTTAMYIGMSLYLGQEPKLDPRPKNKGGDGGDFMRLQVGDLNLKVISGKPYSVARALVRMASSKSPDEASEVAKNWLRSQGSPVLGSTWDVVTGRNFIGEPTGGITGIPANVIAPRLMPFYLNALTEDGLSLDDLKKNAPAMLSEFVGVQAYPLSPFDRLEQKQDELAALFPEGALTDRQIEELNSRKLWYDRTPVTGPLWEILDPRQQQKITNGTTGIREIDSQVGILADLDKKAKAERARTGDTERVEFFRGIDQAREVLEERAQVYSSGVNAGRLSPQGFRKAVGLAQQDFSSKMELVWKEGGQNDRVIREIEQDKSPDKFQTMVELAKAAYDRRVGGNDALTDAFGQYDFKARDRIISELEDEYGADVVDSARQISTNNKEMPLLWRRWESDRDRLRRYWEIRDEYLSANPEVRFLYNQYLRARTTQNQVVFDMLSKHPLIKAMNKEITARRHAMRDNDPELDAIASFWIDNMKPRTGAANAILAIIRKEYLS